MDDTTFTRRAIEAAIRIGLLLALVAWCFQILSPFITPVIWAAVIATALDPVHRWLAARMGGRRTLSAVAITLVALAVLLVPATLLTETTVTGVRNVANQLQEGTLVIPPPPERVADLPVIGESLQEFWKLASINLDAALKQLEPQLRSLAAWLLSTAAGAGLGLMLFLLSIMIAGFLLTRSDQMGAAADVIAVRLAGERGREFMDLAAATVRSVAQGVLGVALIQTVLAQIGMVVIGVPASGLWALLILFLAIAQLPTIIVLLPIILYVYSTHDATPATIFAIWSVAVGVSDTFLKPILLGRGVQVPMLVVLLGAIGGMITQGILGLFVGAVVLAVGYELFMAWVRHGAPPEEASDAS